jgi:hypothetical protein
MPSPGGGRRSWQFVRRKSTREKALQQVAGKPDIGFDWITVLICALAGLF